MTVNVVVEPPHPASLSDEDLRRQCSRDFGRASGPGGQNRNKVETAVRLTHVPTGIGSAASERRSQSENLSVAEHRLRLKLAVGVRSRIDPDRYKPSDLWLRRRQGTRVPANPDNHDYPALLAEALDVAAAQDYDLGPAAATLGVSPTQLARLIRHDRPAFDLLNEERRQRGLPGLK